MATLITDASFHESGAAGWACWVKTEGKDSHTQGGVIQCVEVRCSNEAELAACLHGLSVAVRYAPGENILLQSDSMHALHLLRHELGLADRPHKEGRAVPKTKVTGVTVTEKRLVEAINAVLSVHKARVAVRHVKGHQHGRGRSWVNGLCDRVAKRHMREARDGAHLRALEAAVKQVAEAGRGAQ